MDPLGKEDNEISSQEMFAVSTEVNDEKSIKVSESEIVEKKESIEEKVIIENNLSNSEKIIINTSINPNENKEIQEKIVDNKEEIKKDELVVEQNSGASSGGDSIIEEEKQGTGIVNTEKEAVVALNEQEVKIQITEISKKLEEEKEEKHVLVSKLALITEQSKFTEEKIQNIEAQYESIKEEKALLEEEVLMLEQKCAMVKQKKIEIEQVYQELTNQKEMLTKELQCLKNESQEIEKKISTSEGIIVAGEQLVNEEKNLDDSEENLPEPPQILFREPSSSDPEAPESTHHYFQHLGSLRLQMNDWGPEQLSTYIYPDSPLDQEGLSRMNKEIKALTRALPCEPSGAVFVSIDSSNLSRLKVLISGTEDTPYEHGLFLFDIKLDPNYPNSPPKMTIKTTGGGTLRFNPNLYDSGYVCLSIINTWGGDPEEMWNPSYSTLMQVFLSIQALVMNNDVIQKEPGYEHMSTSCPENQDYAGIVKFGNISYAMIEMLKEPPEEFKEIVLKHFAIKKEKILKTVEKWVEESVNMGNGYNDYILSCHNPTSIALFRDRGAQVVFTEIFEELKRELEKLPSL